jgi:acetyl esterase
VLADLPLRLRVAAAVQRKLAPLAFSGPITALVGLRGPLRLGGRALDPETRVMLAVLALDRSADLTRYAPEEARLRMKAQASSADAPPPSGVVTEKLAATGPAGPIPMRLYTPSGVIAPAPAVVFFHGGGWVLGDLETHDGLCRALAVGAACRVVSVDYRLAPEHPFPAAVDDAVAAFRWVALRAGDLGIDAARIAVAGDSAGGNLAAVVARKTRGDDRRPMLQALIYPGLDATRAQPSHREVARGYYLTESLIDWFLDRYLGATDRAHPDISVLLAEDREGLPPALIYTAGFDPLRDEGRAYAERLSEAGVDARHTEFPSLIHGFVLMRGILPATQRATDEIIADIGRALRRER